MYSLLMLMFTKIHQFLFYNTSYKQTVIKNTFWLFLAEVVSKGSLAVVIILIGRYFGKEIFGQWSYLTTILTFLLIFADLGITQLTIRDRQYLNEKDHAHRLRTGLHAKYLLSVCVIVLYLSILWLTVSRSFLWTVGLMLLFQGIANSFLEYFRAIFRSMQRSEIEMKIKLWQGVGNLTLIPLLIVTHSLPRVLLGQGLITVASCGYAWWITRQKTVNSQTKNNFSRHELIKNSRMFAMSGLFVSMYYYVDSVIIQWYRGYEAVGIYTAAYKVTTLLILPISLFGNACFPLFRSLFIDDVAGLRGYIKKLNRYIRTVSILLFPVLIRQSKNIILLLYGASYQDSIILLQILLCSVRVVYIYHNYSRGLLAIHQKYHTISTLGGLGLNILLNIIFIPKYGPISAAITTVITELFLFFALMIYYKRHTRV